MDDYFVNKSFYSTLGGNGEFLKLLQKMVKLKNYWEKPSFSQINYTDYDLYVLIMNKLYQLRYKLLAWYYSIYKVI